MPIDIETFEEESGFDAGQTHGERIIQFLARNNDQAFERSEIAQATDIDANAVSAVLTRLKERDLVRHKPPYWAIGDPERLSDAAQFRQTLDALDETLGAEEMAEWRSAGAADPYPSDRDQEQDQHQEQEET